MTTITRKLDTLYGAYSAEFDLATYGSCRDEALNNLAEEIIQHTSDAPRR